MKLCPCSNRLSSADAGLLLLLMSAQIVGYVAAIWSLPWMMKALAMLAFEVILLAWVASWKVKPGERRINLGYTVRLQVHAATQILSTLYFIGLCALASFWVLGQFQPQGPWSPYRNLDTVLHLHDIGLSLALLAAQLLGAARLHDLHRKGLRLADVQAGSLNQRATELPASMEKAGERLAFYLNKLTQPGAPTMQRLWYGNTPVLRETVQDGARAYVMSWRDCPSRIRIALSQAGPGASALRVQCELRGGPYALDMMVNPHDAMALMEFMQANVVQLLSSEFALSALTANQEALRLRTAEMQLRMLQAQIEPHFLFNTLANVRQLYRSSASAGEDMLDHLIAYLRSAMDELRAERSSVAREFELVSHYLAIMQIRMGERLSYRFVQPGDVASHAFPPAMLISLVENAIMHGLHKREQGLLTISAAIEGNHLRVTVQDNGEGFSSVQGSGTGLSNIRQRLEALYGKHARLEAGALQEGGFSASIFVPHQIVPTVTLEK